MANHGRQNLNSPSSNTTPTSIVVDRAIERRLSNWPAILTFFLTVLGLTVGMAVWASNSHADIKDWTAGQDFVTKQELKNTMKDHYVPLHEFAKVKQSLDDHKVAHEQMEKKLDRVLDALQTKRRR